MDMDKKSSNFSNQRILVTGYGPFLDHLENPSLKVAALMDEISDRCDHIELPVEFSKLDESLAAVSLEKYCVIILLGLAGSRTMVTPEKVALNWCYCPGRPDNEGRTFEQGEKLIEDGANALFATFPVEELTDFLKKKGIESQLSFTAGTYVCNATFYKVLNSCMKTKSKACFIHIPAKVDCRALAESLIEFIESLTLE